MESERFDEFVPTVADVTPEERRYAINALDENRKHGNTLEALPPDVHDIFARWQIVSDERSLYNRDDTCEIPKRILDPSKKITIDDILGMLHVYYWWNEDSEEPQDYLEDLLADLDDKQFKEAARALHGEFPELCQSVSEGLIGSVCRKKDGYKCFIRATQSYHSKQETASVLASPKQRAEEVMSWLEEVDADAESIEDDFDERLTTYEAAAGRQVMKPHGLAHLLGDYATKKLLQAGADEIEAADAPNILGLESDRRDAWRDDYSAFRDGGGTFDQFIHDFLPNEYVENSGKFEFVTEEFEDLPDDAIEWPTEKKIALARRFTAANRDFYFLNEVSYQSRTNGIVPPYHYRFATHLFPSDT